MKINEKIKFIREMKGWSQKEMAENLNMSTSGYANIERGETNVQYSRLEQIAKLLDLKLSELTDLDDKNFQIFLTGNCNDGDSSITIHSSETQLQHKLEMNKLTINQQQKEILYLKEEVNNLKEIITNLKKIIELSKKK